MEFKTVKITAENRKQMWPMDPLLLSDKLELKGYFALAAMPADGDDEACDYLGCVLCSYIREKLVIEWLYVHPEFRGMGVGEFLLNEVYEVAKDRRADRMFAYFSDNAVCEKYFAGSREYFENFNFTEDEELGGEWNFSLYGLNNALQNIKKVRTSENIRILSFGDLEKNLRKKLFEILETVPSVYPVLERDRKLDKDISMVMLCNDEIAGYIICQSVCDEFQETDETGRIVKSEKDYTIFPLAADVNSDSKKYLLAKAALDAAKKKYSPATMVHVELRESRNGEYLATLFPESRIQNYFYSVGI